jgi:mannitol/fructose-specific phosphotransferase system IIA component (Ntr-type)
MLDLSASSMESLLEQMVRHVAVAEPSLNRQHLLQELLAQDAESTGIPGSGVAIPHCYCHGLHSSICAVARLAEAVTLGTIPGAQPVHLVFLLLSPSGDPGSHLSAMAEIARLADNANARFRLRAAPPEKLHDELLQLLAPEGGA